MILVIFVSILAITYSAPEKGIGLAWRDCNDAAQLNVGWMYTWQPFHPCPNQQISISWIPMIFSHSQLWYLDTLNGQYEAILGFNEPDASNQGNMSPQQALDAWPKMQDYAIRKGIRLGSPATTEQEAFGWMKTFMQGVWARGYKVDFLCFHFYFNRWLTEFDEFNDLRVFLNKIKAHYPGYKIWITEISWRFGTAQENYNAMLAVYDMIRKEYPNLVERWAWFTNRWRLEDGTYSSNGWDLMYWDGSLTELGKLYRWLPIYPSSQLTENEKEDDASVNWATWLAISLLGILLLCCLIGAGIYWRRKIRSKKMQKQPPVELVESDQKMKDDGTKGTGYDMSTLDSNIDEDDTPISTNNNNEDELQDNLQEIEVDVEI